MKHHVTLRELAQEFGREKTVIRKFVRKHGISFIRVRTEQGRWQSELALTPEDAEAVRKLRRAEGFPVPKS